MSPDTAQRPLARRSFLSRLGAGAAAFGAALGAAPALQAQGVQPASGGFSPARHPEDDWFDQTGSAKHRLFYDTTSAEACGYSLFWSRNFFAANATGYKLTDQDLAVVICLRHESTSFAFTDAIWAKYGPMLSERAGHFVDPKTKGAPALNVYMATGYGDQLKNNNVTLDAMAKRGVRFAVCSLATRAAASLIAQKTGGSVDAVFKELTENLVSGGHMVPAGIVAVNRAQERGYTFTYVG
jgi:intracellular sulfur oxidation DsrE/DsrF family protein